MSGELVVAVLSEAWQKFNGFPVARQPEIAAWVKRRVDGIRAGHGMPPTAKASPAKSMEQPPSWYEREPGEEG